MTTALPASNRHLFFFCFLVLVACCCAAFAQNTPVAHIGITRSVEVTDNGKWGPALQGQGLWNNQGVRTLKRSLADITFPDNSMLRLSEQTDLVVQTAANMRTIKLTAGAVWVHVNPGSNTTVETPSATATARGTEFIVIILPNGQTRVYVFRGKVDLTALTISRMLNPRQYADTSGPGGAPTEPAEIPDYLLPASYGGAADTAFFETGSDAGTYVTVGGPGFEQIRTAPLADTMTNQEWVSERWAYQYVNGALSTDSMDKATRQTSYQPGHITDWNFERRLIDRTDTSYAALGAGVVAGLLADKHNNEVGRPGFSGALFSFGGDQGLMGGRLEVRGTIGSSRYLVEGNALKLDGGITSDWITRADSVAVVKRNLTPTVTAFAGRDHFFEGPVVQNAQFTQLIADRFSGVGVTAERKHLDLKGAWVYDSNPISAGAQGGALASAALKTHGGIVGLQYLQTTGVTPGTGQTVSWAMPIVPNKLETYGELGKGVDGATLQTYGVYFPGLYQKQNVDLFAEYGNHEGIGEAFSVIAASDVNKNLQVRGSIDWINNKPLVGVGGITRFDAK